MEMYGFKLNVIAFDNVAGTAAAAVPVSVMYKTNDKNQWVASRAPDSAAMVPYWDKTDDIVAGEEAIKLATTKYLPRFPQELDEDYNFRIQCGVFTNIYQDILEGLASKPFEREVALEKGAKEPAPILKFIENVDGLGNNLTTFAATTFYHAINSAVDWIFVDYPDAPLSNRPRTIADEKQLGISPFWTRVIGRNVLECQTKMIVGKATIVYMRVLEPGSPKTVREMKQIGAVATWQTWQQKAGHEDEWIEFENGIFSIGEIPLVPLVTGKRKGNTYCFQPPMNAAADLQIRLYNNETDLEFAKTMTAHPMLAGNGVKPDMDPKGTPKPIGSGPGRVVYAPMSNEGRHGEWVFIEPQATSLTFLQTSIDKRKQDLRELGRQPLTAQSGNLTVITTAFAASKARSAVAAWGLRLKDALENALRLTALWLNLGDYEPSVMVYDEYDNFIGDNTVDVAQLQAMRVNKDISRETLWQEMKRRNVLSQEFNEEAEAEALLKEMPTEVFPPGTFTQP